MPIDDRAGREQPRAPRRRRAGAVGEGRAGGGGRHAGDVDVVLDRERHAVERQRSRWQRQRARASATASASVAQRDEHRRIVMGRDAGEACARPSRAGLCVPARWASTIGRNGFAHLCQATCDRAIVTLSLAATLTSAHAISASSMPAFQTQRGRPRGNSGGSKSDEMASDPAAFAQFLSRIRRSGLSLRMPRVQIFPRFTGHGPRARSWHRACDIAPGIGRAAAARAGAPVAVVFSNQDRSEPMPLPRISRRHLLQGTAGAGATTVPGRAAYAKDTIVGFIYVGPRDDYGYNQAHAAGAAAVKKHARRQGRRGGEGPRDRRGRRRPWRA